MNLNLCLGVFYLHRISCIYLLPLCLCCQWNTAMSLVRDRTVMTQCGCFRSLHIVVFMCIYLSIHPSVYLSICLSIYLSFYLDNVSKTIVDLIYQLTIFYGNPVFVHVAAAVDNTSCVWPWHPAASCFVEIILGRLIRWAPGEHEVSNNRRKVYGKCTKRAMYTESGKTKQLFELKH